MGLLFLALSFACPVHASDLCTAIFIAANGAMVFLPASGRISEKLVREWRARKEEKKYLGFGVIYDFSSIKERFTKAEQVLFEFPEENRVEIIKLLNARLSANYDHTAVEKHTKEWLITRLSGFNWDAPIEAASLFDSHSRIYGVCRHKAIVMAAFLSDLGFNAYFQPVLDREESLLSEKRHSVVVLADLDLVADPTAGTIHRAAHFWKKWRKVGRWGPLF